MSTNNLIRVAKQFGFTIGDTNVLQYLSTPNDFKELKVQYEYFQKNMDQIPKEFQNSIRSKTVTTALLQYLMREDSEQATIENETMYIQVANAFDSEKLVLEKTRGGEIVLKRVSVKPEDVPKLGEASDAINMHRQHYQNIVSLIRSDVSIISSNSLLGTKGVCHVLCRLGRACFDTGVPNIFWAEDLDGRFRVDLSKWIGSGIDSVGVVSIGTYAIMRGIYDPDEKLFVVSDVSLPELDTNRVRYLKSNFKLARFGLTSRQVENIMDVEKESQGSEFMLVLQDIHLDDPNVIRKLTLLFEGYSQFPPTLILFIGSFTSRDHQHFSRQEYRALFQSLANIIVNCGGKSLLEESVFVFVPGPYDATLTADVKLSPRAPIPSFFIKQLKEKIPSNNVYFASNPCNIRFLSKDICVYREDLIQKFMRHSVVNPNPSYPPHVHVAKTIYTCAHLSPLDQSFHPTFWKYDHALRLLPQPDFVILADSSSSFSHKEDETHFVNPSSFSKFSSFVEFYPLEGKVEFKKIS